MLATAVVQEAGGEPGAGMLCSMEETSDAHHQRFLVKGEEKRLPQENERLETECRMN